MTIVLDTHVLAAGVLSGETLAGRVVDLIRAGRLRLAVDERILREYGEVLSQPPFEAALTPERRERLLIFMRADAARPVCTATVRGLPDPKDACFAETAMAADSPLVTDDFRRFPAERCGRTRIFSLIRFLEEFHRPA